MSNAEAGSGSAVRQMLANIAEELAQQGMDPALAKIVEQQFDGEPVTRRQFTELSFQQLMTTTAVLNALLALQNGDRGKSLEELKGALDRLGGLTDLFTDITKQLLTSSIEEATRRKAK